MAEAAAPIQSLVGGRLGLIIWQRRVGSFSLFAFRDGKDFKIQMPIVPSKLLEPIKLATCRLGQPFAELQA